MPQNKESQETPAQITMMEIFHGTAREWYPTHEEFLGAFETKVFKAIAGNSVALKDYVEFKVSERLRLEEMATKDFLTGLWARAGFEERFKEELERSRLVAFLMIDLDNFKKVNDTFGHPEGDRVLIACAEILKEITRDVGFAARLGGEELAVVLPITEAEKAIETAREINQRFSSIPEEKAITGITASIGIYTSQPGDTKETILKRADQAELAAKAAGGNQVCVWKPEYQPKD